jgi:6-phosphogluconate dehydrogenase (decarboxylating)
VGGSKEPGTAHVSWSAESEDISIRELMERGLRENSLEDLRGYVVDTREVKWVVQFALEKEAWIPVIAQSELALYRYRDLDSVAGKGVALLRHGFGGHPIFRQCEEPKPQAGKTKEVAWQD